MPMIFRENDLYDIICCYNVKGNLSNFDDFLTEIEKKN